MSNTNDNVNNNNKIITLRISRNNNVIKNKNKNNNNKNNNKNNGLPYLLICGRNYEIENDYKCPNYRPSFNIWIAYRLTVFIINNHNH